MGEGINARKFAREPVAACKSEPLHGSEPPLRRSMLVDTVLAHPPIVPAAFETRGGQSTLYNQQASTTEAISPPPSTRSPLQQPAPSQPRNLATPPVPVQLTSPPAAQRQEALPVEAPQAPATVDVVQMQRELAQLRDLVRDQRSVVARARADREVAMQQAAKAEQQAAQVSEIAMMVNPQPSTLNPQPSTLKAQTHNLNPQPSNMHP